MNEPLFTVGKGDTLRPQDRPSRLPWLIAGLLVLGLAGLLLAVGRPKTTTVSLPNTEQAPAAYAAQLVVSNVQMSESGNLSGGKLTYLDGTITNRGTSTVNSVVVQVAFRDAMHRVAQNETMPLQLIRMREPYVDTQPVAAAPVAPGTSRDFRLIFDHVSAEWDGQYPEVRIIQVGTR